MLITLLTDFGTRDTFVGQMKGVILSRCPGAVVVDLTHEIGAQDVLGGALALESAVDAFPRGTVHLAVVDPGVGSQRAAVAIATARAFYVGPDNGLLGLVLRRDPPLAAVRLTNAFYQREPVSPTFHGRDLFAPAAAHLAGGGKIQSLGETLDPGKLHTLELPAPRRESATVLAIDRFGNVTTNLTDADLADIAAVRGGERWIERISRTYSDVPEGEPVAYLNSAGRLEIAIRNGNASDSLHLHPGDPVPLRRR
jgi:S-adenosylmethionine hydrolase